MKIRPPELPIETLPLKPQKVQKRAAQQEDVHVAVSQTARLLSQSSGNGDSVDLERVAKLRDQIQAGAYEIDDMALARALVTKELQWKPGQQ